MNARTALDVLREEARSSHEWLSAIVADVTPEQASWRPPGRANTIAGTYAHIVRNQDEDMNHGFLGRPMLSERDWIGRTGLPSWWDDSDKNEWEIGAPIDWLALRAYGDAVPPHRQPPRLDARGRDRLPERASGPERLPIRPRHLPRVTSQES